MAQTTIFTVIYLLMMMLYLFSALTLCGASRPVDNIEHIIVFMQENRCNVVNFMLNVSPEFIK